MEFRSATGRLAPAAPSLPLRPLIGVATIGLVLLALVVFGPSGQALGAAFVVCVVALVTVVDLEERRIPNRIVLPATAAALGVQIALAPREAPKLVGIALAAGLFFYLPMLLFRGGMGMGDVKLAIFLGATLSEAVVAAIAVAVLAAFFAAMAVLIRNGVEARKSAIPFGPFLALGAVVAIFFA
jgi:prepilin signal peptidase PulO-like enzyme (type II secretory pathway)